MFILNTGTPAAPGAAPATPAPAAPATPAPSAAPAAPAAKPATAPVTTTPAPAQPVNEAARLRQELEETKRRNQQEVERAYKLGRDSAVPVAPVAPTPAPAAPDDDDIFGIAPIIERVISTREANKERITTTEATLEKAVNWAKENIDFYNKNIPANDLARKAVGQAYQNHAMNPKVPFVEHLQDQLTLVGVQKITPNGNTAPTPAPGVTNGQSDYGGMANPPMNPGEELAIKTARLAELKAKAAGGFSNDALIREVGNLSFEIQRLSKQR